MTGKFKFLLIVGIISLIGLSIIGYLFPSIVTSAVCSREKEFAELEFRAIVKDKFIDENNHASEVLSINAKDNMNHNLYLAGDSSSLYSYAVVGDSILKDPGTMDVTIKRSYGSSSFTVDFYCYEEE